MSVQFFVINKSDTRIVGWQRSSSDNAPPSDTSDTQYIVASDAQLDQFNTLQMQASQEARIADIRWDGTNITLQPDARIYVDIIADKTQVAADNVDFITFTITALKIDDTPDNTINTTIIEQMTPGRFFQVQFVNGVASKQVKFPDTGQYTIQSNNSVRIKTPLKIVAYE